MATISENLQIIADSTAAIKQAIIDKGGEITGDISTWAEAINGISGGGSEDSGSTGEEINLKCVITADPYTSQDIIDNNISLYNFLITKYGATGSESNPTNISNDTPKIFCSDFSNVRGQCTYIYIQTSGSSINLYDDNGMMSYYCVRLTSEGYASNFLWD